MATTEWIENCLRNVASAKIAIVGDFCLDAYWFIEPDGTELSVETGLTIGRVQTQRYAPGGAGNVAANLISLGVAKVTAIGAIGRDPFGDKLIGLLSELRVDTSPIYREQADWQTFVYAKPCIGPTEQNRLDFGAFNKVSAKTANHVIAALRKAADAHDVIIVNQQIPNGLCDDSIIVAINEIASSHPNLKIIVDSRDHAAKYAGVTLKINAAEAARLQTGPNGLQEPIAVGKVHELAESIQQKTRRPVFITRGERGLMVADNGRVEDSSILEFRLPERALHLLPLGDVFAHSFIADHHAVLANGANIHGKPYLAAVFAKSLALDVLRGV